MDLTQHTQRDELRHSYVPGASDQEEFDDEWDEEETGQRASKTSVPGAVFSYVCTCVGAGVLSLPRALQECGWIGLIVMAIVALLCTITTKYLAECMFAKPGELLRTYEAIGEQALGKKGRLLVGFFQSVTLFGVCTIFLILIGGNMNTLVDTLSLHDWIFIFAGILIPIAWLKTMNEVAVLAYFGVFASLFVAAVVIVKGFMRFADPGEGVPAPTYDAAKWGGLPNAINIIVFSFGAHSVFPNIISHVRSPRRNYVHVSNYSNLLIAGIYMATAAGGYAGWGRDTNGKVLDNMNSGSGIVKAAYGFITAHVVLAYPIPLNPLCLALESSLGIDQHKGARELIPRIATRTALVLLTVLVASVVPYFGDILSLVSALSIVVVAFVLPPWFLYLLHPHRVFTLVEKTTMALIVVFGVVSSGIGLYFALDGLVTDIKANPNPFAHYF